MIRPGLEGRWPGAWTAVGVGHDGGERGGAVQAGAEPPAQHLLKVSGPAQLHKGRQRAGKLTGSSRARGDAPSSGTRASYCRFQSQGLKQRELRHEQDVLHLLTQK